MALPTDRASFKKFCLQQIGAPVLRINMADEQIENQIDLALAYYADFHFDGSMKQYYKLPITDANHSDAVHHVTVTAGGTGYANTDTVVFTSQDKGGNAAATLTTYANGTIATINMTNNGGDYSAAPTVTVTTGTGSGAILTAELGGYFTLPDNILGISKVFPFSYMTSSQDMFSVEYQFALNNLYNIANSQLVPWYMSLQHLQLFQEILVGRTPFRFNRSGNKLYVDQLNDRLKTGEYLVVEAYFILSPDEYSKIWRDRFLIRYTCALLKKMWGFNLTKFKGTQLTGGITFSAEKMYDDAVEEIKELEAEMINTWSLPVADIVA